MNRMGAKHGSLSLFAAGVPFVLAAIQSLGVGSFFAGFAPFNWSVHGPPFDARWLCRRGCVSGVFLCGGIVNLFVKWRILMGYKEESSGRTMRSGEVSAIL